MWWEKSCRNAVRWAGKRAREMNKEGDHIIHPKIIALKAALSHITSSLWRARCKTINLYVLAHLFRIAKKTVEILFYTENIVVIGYAIIDKVPDGFRINHCFPIRIWLEQQDWTFFSIFFLYQDWVRTTNGLQESAFEQIVYCYNYNWY